MTGGHGTGGALLHGLWKVLDRPSVDWAVAVIVTALVWWRASAPLLRVNATQMTAGLAALAAVLALVGTFGVTAVLFFADRKSRVAVEVRQRYGVLLRRTLLGTFGAMVLSSLGCAVALLFVGGSFARLYFLFAISLAVIKVVRTTVVFEGLIVADERSEYLAEKPAPKLAA